MPSTRFNTVALVACAVLWLAIVLHQIYLAGENPNSGRTPVASQARIAAFAKSTLDSIQDRSISNRMELCGLILEDDSGDLSVSSVSEGAQAECSLPWILPRGLYAVATFHTHGAHDDAYDSEAPSVIDMEADIGEQIDGYIATPGGRVWHIDWDTEEARELCGERCIVQDPNYQPDRQDPVAGSYTLRELQSRQSEDY